MAFQRATFWHFTSTIGQAWEGGGVGKGWGLILSQVNARIFEKFTRHVIRRENLKSLVLLFIQDIIHLLSFCPKTTQFAYNGTYY